MEKISKADNHLIILDSDSFISPENQIDFVSLNNFLEGLCKFICNRILYFPKNRITLIIHNRRVLQILSAINEEQPVFCNLEVLIKNQAVSLKMLKDLSLVSRYFESLQKIIREGDFEEVLKSEEFQEEVYRPICQNLVYRVKALNEQAQVSLRGNRLYAFCVVMLRLFDLDG